MRHAARFGMPVVTFVDTPGAYPGHRRRGARPVDRDRREHHGDVAAAGPDRHLVTGEGGSGGALALAVGDRVLMMENSYYSVISPEGCSTILFKDAAQAPRAAEALRLTAPDLLRLGIMDAVVPEPEGGAHTDPVGDRGERQGRDRRVTCDELLGVPAGRAARAPLRPLPRVRRPGPPAHTVPDRGEHMSEPDDERRLPDQDFVRVVWEEARDLIKRLEGSTVQRLRRRGRRTRDRDRAWPPARCVGRWPRRAPPARRRCGRQRPAHAAAEADGRHPGRSRRSSAPSTARPQPGAKAFVEEGDIVDAGQTVAIVEAMKLMNQVQRRAGAARWPRSSRRTATGSSSSRC